MKRNLTCILIFAVVIISFTYLTYERNKVWQDDVALWKDVVEKTPDNPRAHNNLGRAYSVYGRESEAIEEFKKAMEILPGYALPYMNIAVSYSKLEMVSEAEFYYKKAIELYPKFADAYYNYGFFLYSKERYKEAYGILNKYIELAPTGTFVPFTDKLLSDMEQRGYGK